MFIMHCHPEAKPPFVAQRGVIIYCYCGGQEWLPVAVLITAQLKESPTETLCCLICRSTNKSLTNQGSVGGGQTPATRTYVWASPKYISQLRTHQLYGVGRLLMGKKTFRCLSLHNWMSVKNCCCKGKTNQRGFKGKYMEICIFWLTGIFFLWSGYV